MAKRIYILGGGMTGLAAGMASGLPVLEAAEAPGGICSSYYIRPGSTERLHVAPDNGEAYRFEIGGGHWIFGGDPTALRFIRSLAPVKTYYRSSAVYFRERDCYIQYPLQNHLGGLGPTIAGQALAEMAEPRGAITTMADWLRESFGPTLCDLFFYPFHEHYTAGLYHEIAPQDAYKSPVHLPTAIQGAFTKTEAVGYNTSYLYPEEGLNTLALRMAEQCDIRYGKRVDAIDAEGKVLHLAGGEELPYDVLLSTLPLNRMVTMTDTPVQQQPDPATAVLVLNIGAVRGERCPEHHWLYNPDTKSGFHRAGFYSNVDRSFLPASQRPRNEGVSIYVEKGYKEFQKPTDAEIEAYSKAVVAELQEWGYIKEAQVVDPTWIDTGYTWAMPGSTWKQEALKALDQRDIVQVGRYARWIFQGIADSVRDGFMAGSAAKGW